MEGEYRQYTRVIPRDLFNEADLLKCYGRLYILLETAGAHLAKLSDANLEQEEPFEIGQSQDDGSISVLNVIFTIDDVRWRLERPLNCRDPWPLYCVSFDGEIRERVFTEKGDFSAKFLEIIFSTW